MKKILNQIIYFFIITMVLLTGSVFAVTFEPIEAPYTEEYKEYIELSDEEKSKILEPRKYDLSNEENRTNTALLENEKISLKNLIRVLRSSANASAGKFTLKDLIPNNLAIRNQKSVNACWAFAAISSLETNLALKNYNNSIAEKIYDFSERHMAYTMSQSFLTGQTNPYGYNKKVSDGGTYLMAVAYLTNGQGAILEADMPFVDTQEDIDISQIQNKTVQTTVNNTIWLDSITDVKNAEEAELTNLQQEMKEHISTYGALYAGVYAPDGSEQSKNYINYDTGGMYVDEIKSWTEAGESDAQITYTTNPNHAVAIIGWDDAYAKENFTITPNNDGAWIVKNSWGEKEEYTFDEIKEIIGTEVSEEQLKTVLDALKEQGYTIDEENQKVTKKLGDDGIFYVSYEDATIYTNLFGVVSANDSKTYDNLYQHDQLGVNYVASYEATKTEDTYIANVFDRGGADVEYLTSIGISNYVEGTYEVYINPDGSSKAKEDLQKAELTTGSEITLTAGYNTINLEKPYQLTGNNFVIALKLKHTEGEYTYLSFESKKGDENSSSNAGESFVTFESYFSTDSNWVDIGDSSSAGTFVGNFCIKGITVDNYSGETANAGVVDPGGDDTGNNTTGGNTIENNTAGENIIGNNTTGGNTTENNTTGGNTTDNNTGGGTTEEDLPENSKFDNAKAYLTNMKVNIDNNSTNFEIQLEIRNIQVNQLNDNYEHYFYISSDANKTDIPESKWEKVDSFERQADGTYTIKLTINKESQLSDFTDDSQNAYLYIKEVATKGTKTSTVISNAMPVDIDTSDLEFNTENDGDKVVIYNPQIQGGNASTSTSTSSTDNTTAVTYLPKTGIKTVLVVIGVLAIVFVITYVKYRKMKDIK